MCDSIFSERMLSMGIKPIKNDRDYRKAMKEIHRLMDARRNAPDGNRVDALGDSGGSLGRKALVCRFVSIN